jgi:3-hydroxyisobutyrate dehydrogenase-like beta-hydroxyacid dehydrogenase
MGVALLAAGIPVVAYDVTEQARARAVADGATVAASPREAGSSCGVVLVSLPGPYEVPAAILDEAGGLLSGMAAGSTIIDTTTTSLEMVKRVADMCAAKGVGYLDAPVSGRPPKMSMLIGGPESLVEQHRPLLTTISTDQFLLGPAGAGTTTKLMNQYISFASFLIVGEAAALAERAGVSKTVLVDALSRSSAASFQLELYRHSIVDKDLPFTPGSVGMTYKDMRLVAACAEALGVPESPALAWVQDAWRGGAHDPALANLPFPELLRTLESDLGWPAKEDQ